MQKDVKRKSALSGLSAESSETLRGKQSVRATFRLTQQAVDTISAVSIHLKIRQKSLFDHLIEDTETLEQIGREIDSAAFKKIERVQKTYVLSRKTILILEQMCGRFSIPRDALVEYSVRRLLPVIEKEKEKHIHRKQLMRAFEKNIENLHEIAEESLVVLSRDDPVSLELKKILTNCRSTYREITEFIEKGKIIETFILPPSS